MKVMMSVCGDVVWMRMHARGEARQLIKRESEGAETVGKELSGRATGQLHVFGLIIISPHISLTHSPSFSTDTDTVTPGRTRRTDYKRTLTPESDHQVSSASGSVTSPLPSQSLAVCAVNTLSLLLYRLSRLDLTRPTHCAVPALIRRITHHLF
jgi:hypothetical protein